MKDKLAKLAAALRGESLEEEADSVESLTEAYFRSGDNDWRSSLPSLSGEIWGLGLSDAQSVVSDKYSTFEWAGSGAFRYTVAPKGDDAYVAKIARSDRGSVMNKSEFDNQLAFNGMFPKVLDHGSSDRGAGREYKGSEFDWIIVDRVSPVSESRGLIPFFPELSSEMKEQRVQSTLFSVLLGRLLHWESSNMGGDVGGNSDGDLGLAWWEKDPDFFFVKKIKEYIQTGDKGAKSLLEAARRDRMFRRLADLSAKLGIDARDLGVGNLGVNSEGDLMVLDASLEKDFA
jgi:hypothetical protein